MKKGILIGMLAMLLAPAVMGQGIPIMGQCINSSYLRTYTIINVSGTDMPLEVTNVYCPYGCNSTAAQYGADCVYQEQCIEKGIAGFNLGYNAELFGLMLALVGVGVTVDSIIGFAEKRGGKVW